MIFAHRREFLLESILDFFGEIARVLGSDAVRVAVTGNRVTPGVRSLLSGRVHAEYYSDIERYGGGADHDAEIQEWALRSVERDFKPEWILHHNDDFVFEDGAVEEIARATSGDLDVILAGNRLFFDWEHYLPDVEEPWDPVLWRWRPGAHFWPLSTSFLPVDLERDAYARGTVGRMEAKRLDFGFVGEAALREERRISRALGRLDPARDWVFRSPGRAVPYERKWPGWLRRSSFSACTVE